MLILLLEGIFLSIVDGLKSVYNFLFKDDDKYLIDIIKYSAILKHMEDKCLNVTGGANENSIEDLWVKILKNEVSKLPSELSQKEFLVYLTERCEYFKSKVTMETDYEFIKRIHTILQIAQLLINILKNKGV